MSDWARVIDLANSDCGFRSKLKSDAIGACAEAGCHLTPGMGIRVVEQGTGEVHFVLGTPTGIVEIDAVLDKAASDPILRYQLLNDATPILRTIPGQNFPVETKVFVHERHPHETLILLRDEQDGGQLDESQLESIAGGLSNPQSKSQRPSESNGIIAILIG